MSVSTDQDVLDDRAALDRLDRGGMLRQVATAAAQVREGLVSAEEVVAGPRFRWLLEGGRPRALVVTGMGGSGIAGDVLAACCGIGCPVPLVTVRGHRLPGWVGSADVVMAVSCSGSTDETVSVATDAVRRGCRLFAVGAGGSPLAAVAEQAGTPFVPLRPAGQPRATLWGLSVPLLVAARALRLLDVPDGVFEVAARRLEDLAVRCGPAGETFANPAKDLAMELTGTLPMVWGTSPLAATAAYRCQCQLAENAKYPAISGQLPEAAHNQVVTFDGPFGIGAEPGSATAVDSLEYFFRDRVEERAEETRLRLVVFRDAGPDGSGEDPRIAARADQVASMAENRNIPVSTLWAGGHHALERLADLVGLVDYATVYLALACGIDPTPVAPIQELREDISSQ